MKPDELLSAAITFRLNAVVAGKIAPWQFEDWLEGASINMHQYADANLMSRVGEIEQAFFEHGNSGRGIMKRLREIRDAEALP